MPCARHEAPGPPNPHPLEGQRELPIFRFTDTGGWSEGPDTVVEEEPLEIRLRFGPADDRQERTLAVTMRTPGQDNDLVRGFLFSERLIDEPGQIESIEARPVRREEGKGHTLTASLRPDIAVRWDLLERHFYLSSSCGVCGKASVDAVLQRVDRSFFPMTPRVAASVVPAMPGKLREAQTLFSRTGGLHASGLFDQSGKLLLLREDVGRHNACDKLIGALLDGAAPREEAAAVVLSGRISFELVQKVLLAGIPVLIAVGAPSSLAVDLAEESGMTLVGFTAPGRFNVYAGRQRIVG